MREEIQAAIEAYLLYVVVAFCIKLLFVSSALTVSVHGRDVVVSTASVSSD